MKQLIFDIFEKADIFLFPFVYISSLLLKYVRRVGVHKMPRCKSALLAAGAFPINDHYYEPQFDHRNPRKLFSEDRLLPGIDWNVAGQLAFLSKLSFAKELTGIPQSRSKTVEFYWGNGAFESGDGEYWYQLIRDQAGQDFRGWEWKLHVDGDKSHP